MKAERQGDNIVVTLTPTEAHVLIWGGKPKVVDAVDSDLRNALVSVEDGEFTDDEYNAMMGDILATYEVILREHRARKEV